MPWPPPIHAVDKPYFAFAATQLVQERDQQSRARRSQRMAQGDGAAVHIHFAAIESEFLLDREILPGKRFVDFDQIDDRRA